MGGTAASPTAQSQRTLLTLPSLAAFGGLSFSGYGSSERADPYDTNPTIFLSLVAASNPTSIFSLPLPGVSKP
jgi:hypothetical protein